MSFWLKVSWLITVLISSWLIIELEGQTDSTTTTAAPIPVVTMPAVTRPQYITLTPRGPDYFDDINPWKTKTATTTTTTPMPTGTTWPPAEDVFQCQFDQGLCNSNFDTQNANFNWTRWTSQCPHVYTGPPSDHTTGFGYYMYIDCSQPRLSGMVARLITPDLKTTTGCANITFWYYAYGYHLGRFSVQVSEVPYTKWTTVWQISGPSNSQQNWIQASILAPALHYKIAFEGVVGNGYQGDYAIDDILSISTQCPSTTPSNLNATADADSYVPSDITTPAPSGLQPWAIALIVVSVVAAITAVCLAFYIVLRQKKMREQREREEREEEERRRKEIEEEGVIHTDRAYSSRVRSGMPQRPMGRMVASAQRRMAPGYSAKPGSRMGTATYGRLDIPTSAMSKRGYSPNSALALHEGGMNNDSSYGYDQENDIAPNYLAANRAMSGLRPRNDPDNASMVTHNPGHRLPPIFGGETPPSSAQVGPRTHTDITISDVSPMVARRLESAAENVNNNRPVSGKDEKVSWND